MNRLSLFQQFGSQLPPRFAGQLAAAAADIALVLDDHDHVVDATLDNIEDASAISHPQWMGCAFLDLVSDDTRTKAQSMLSDARGGEMPRWRQLNHPQVDERLDMLPVDYMALPLDDDGRVLLLGRDLRPLADLQQRIVRSQQALERDYERYRGAETKYRQLFHFSDQPLLIIDARDSKVGEANEAAIQLLMPWLKDGVRQVIGATFPDDFCPLAGDDTANMLATFFGEARNGRAVQNARLVADTGTAADVAVSISIQYSRAHQADAFIIRLASDKISLLSADQLMGQKALNCCLTVPDGILVSDMAGHIIFANPALAEMVELADPDMLIGEPLDRWMTLPGLSLTALTKNLQQSGHVRLMQAQLNGAYGSERDVEISAAHMVDSDKPSFTVIVRDIATRVTNTPATNSALQDAVQQKASLVGSMSMRDIVRETTDVIERLCIDAALDISKNNRASAAEILGLSRQSLYVKMRRFGQLDTSSDTDDV